MNPVFVFSRSRFKRFRLFDLSAAAAVAAIVFYLVSSAHAADAPPPPPKVTIATVEEKMSVEFRELLGRVEARESVELRAQVSGPIVEVRLQAGKKVEKGDVLFVIDPRPFQAQVDLATAQLERAKVRVKIAQSQSKRSDDLLDSKAISIEEAEIRNSTLAEANAEVLAAEASLETARLDLEYTQVRAPISGLVNRAYLTTGNMVSGTPGNGTVLTTIVSSGEVYVYADVDENTLLTFNRLAREGNILQRDGHVPVEAQLSDEEDFIHAGYVESADNHLDPGTGSLVLRMVFPNVDEELVPGLSARVRLPVSGENPTLFVSERAIGTSQDQKFVMTVGEDNTVAYRQVKLGRVIQGRRIIREGLTAGDRVIVKGLQKVMVGMTVDPEVASR